MAKISARGDREVRRYRNSNGAYLVLTEHGRLLRQLLKGDTYNVIAKGLKSPRDWTSAELADFENHWRARGYEEVQAR